MRSSQTGLGMPACAKDEVSVATSDKIDRTLNALAVLEETIHCGCFRNDTANENGEEGKVQEGKGCA